MGMIDRDWYKEHHQKKTDVKSEDHWYRPKEFRKDAKSVMRQADVKNGLCMRSFFSGFFLACCAWLFIPKVWPFLIEWAAVGYFLMLELIK